jgi:DNA polymerase-1
VDKLLLIDGNAVLHRAYYALPDWRNRSGEATAGVYGFLSMLFKAIDELKPTHLAVVFDNPEPTFRHLMYVGYQTNREKERQVSEDIWGQVEKLKIVFEKMGVPVFCVPGFEADDVIGTLAKQAVIKSFSDLTLSPSPNLGEGDGQGEVIIITGDRDLMQLVNEKVKLFMPQKGLSDGIIIDEDKVMERMGVHPNQIIDYKGLVGDSSDNYPGVTGIGPKTATHLLKEYGTIDNLYKTLVNNAPSNVSTSPLHPSPNLGEGNSSGVFKISEMVRSKLINGYEAAMLSQKLATIRLDAPVTLEIGQCLVPSDSKATEVLLELGYKSIIKRITGVAPEIDDKQTKLFE